MNVTGAGRRQKEREGCVEIEEIIGGREGGVREEEADDGSVDGFYFYPVCVIYANRCSNPSVRETSGDCDAAEVFSHLNGNYQIQTFCANIKILCSAAKIITVYFSDE